MHTRVMSAGAHRFLFGKCIAGGEQRAKQEERRCAGPREACHYASAKVITNRCLIAAENERAAPRQRLWRFGRRINQQTGESERKLDRDGEKITLWGDMCELVETKVCQRQVAA